MSAYDRPPSYYQHNDITDPTPYEDDDSQWGDLECKICRRQIRHGEDVVILNHDSLVETIAVHRACLMDSVEQTIGIGGLDRFLQVMEDLGFEIEEGGAP